MIEEQTVQEIMEEYGSRTALGTGGGGQPRRYLWTDAFAVCNYLALYRDCGEEQYLHQALGLVDQVHEILGRHRDDDPRSGWISGLEEGEGRLHPTAGGLRIGKRQPERRADEPYDQNLEWERDGQYYHYLTKWMHALCCLGRAVDNQLYVVWAAEMAENIHNAFCYTSPDGARRMYWKMSIDLSRPLVASMGQHDPLDGLISYLEIRKQAAARQGTDPYGLDDEISDLAHMCRGENWTTADPLGLGGLLADAWRLARLQKGGSTIPLPGLLQEMLAAAAVGLSIYTRNNSMHLPASHRLAFRELGLAIGLQAVERLDWMATSSQDVIKNESRLASLVEAIKEHLPLRWRIIQFWLKPENREVASWTEHEDINMVMLASSLAPEGFLDL